LQERKKVGDAAKEFCNLKGEDRDEKTSAIFRLEKGKHGEKKKKGNPTIVSESLGVTGKFAYGEKKTGGGERGAGAEKEKTFNVEKQFGKKRGESGGDSRARAGRARGAKKGGGTLAKGEKRPTKLVVLLKGQCGYRRPDRRSPREKGEWGDKKG